jgi:hypothetical protein
MKSDAFREAAEAKDFDAAEGLFAEDVVFRSPFVFRPYPGLDALRYILTNVAQIFEDFKYIEHVEEGDVAILMFEANVGERQLQGVDILKFNSEGLVDEMTVMIRPMTGLKAVADEMGKRLEALGVEPA